MTPSVPQTSPSLRLVGARHIHALQQVGVRDVLRMASPQLALLLNNDGGIPQWPVPTATLSAELVAVDDVNPTDAGLSFAATVAPPDCPNAPSYACPTH